MRLLIAALVLLPVMAAAMPVDPGYKVDRDLLQRRAASLQRLDRILVGEKILELTDNRQLTLRADGKVDWCSVSPDGKYVIYELIGAGGCEFRVVRTSGGRTVRFINGGLLPGEVLPAAKGAPGEVWAGSYPVAWAPDSSQFAMRATRRTLDKSTTGVDEDFIVVYSASGTFKRAIPVQSESAEILGGFRLNRVCDLLFTPDSRSLVTNLIALQSTSQRTTWGEDPGTFDPYRVIRTVDVATGTGRDLFKLAYHFSVVGWSTDGGLLLVTEDEERDLHKLSLDGKSDEVLVKNCAHRVYTSPDGSLAAGEEGALTVKNQFTGDRVELAKGVYYLGWAPNSRMLLYFRHESAPDTVSGGPRKQFRSLWLSAVATGKLNHLCAALDTEGPVSCSRDCQRMAYMSQGQLYVAELTYRTPTIGEKVAAGMALTEGELKQVLMENASQIWSAIKYYASDENGKQLPPADKVMEVLGHDLSDKSVFLHPNTRQNIFTWIDPGVRSLPEIAEPPKTILGELDAGYSWKVVVYADGKVETVARQ